MSDEKWKGAGRTGYNVEGSREQGAGSPNRASCLMSFLYIRGQFVHIQGAAHRKSEVFKMQIRELHFYPRTPYKLVCVMGSLRVSALAHWDHGKRDGITTESRRN